MSCPSTFSETGLRLSFFLTTPAKKPRTECGCQSVAFMIAAMVVPFGPCNIFSTADCFEDDELGAFDDAAWDTALLDVTTGFDLAGMLLLVGRFALKNAFVALAFDLPVAIWLSLGSTTASGAATETSPRKLSSRAGGISRILKTDVFCKHHTRSFRWESRANCEQSYGFLGFG